MGGIHFTPEAVFQPLGIRREQLLRHTAETSERQFVVAQHLFRGGNEAALFFYLGEKISGLAGLAADEEATTLTVASSSLVTGGRQISVLQAW